MDSYQAERHRVTTAMVARVRRLTNLVAAPQRSLRRAASTLGPTMAGLELTYRHGALKIADDPLSGTRATPPPTPPQSPGQWTWQHGPQVCLVRPDGVIATAGPTVADVQRVIDNHPLLRALAQTSDQAF